MGKAPPTGNPHPRPHFYLCGNEDEDEDVSIPTSKL